MSKQQLESITTMYNNTVAKQNRLSETERNLIATTESLINLSKFIFKKGNKHGIGNFS